MLRTILVAVVATAHVLPAQGRVLRAAPASPSDTAAYRAEWNGWRSNRATSVLQPGRPLSYTGLTWLRQGRNTIGSARDNDVRLQGQSVPSRVGVLVRQGSLVTFEPAGGAAARVDTIRVDSITRLRSDADGRASQVTIGSAGFRIVKRVDSIGVRAWDAKRPQIQRFKGIKHFALDPRWRYEGRFVPLDVPKRVAVMTESGVPEEHDIVGSVQTTISGVSYSLTAFRSGGSRLFITFADASSGDESYGFRFLSAPFDSATRRVVLDFNYAYNPDCAFSPFTTCPLPPPENRLKTRLLAGERKLKYERGRR